MIIITFKIILLLFAGYIAYTDYKDKEIWGWQISLLFCLIIMFSWMQNNFQNAAAGSILALLINGSIFGLSYLYYKKETYGLGDVLIHICIGCYLGLTYYLNYYAITSVIMGLIASILLFKKTQKEIPLAPWLLGCLLVYEILQRPIIINF